MDPEQRLKATEAISHPWLIAEGGDLSAHDLGPTIYSLRLFNAKRKLRSSVQQVKTLFAQQEFRVESACKEKACIDTVTGYYHDACGSCIAGGPLSSLCEDGP